MSYEEDYRRPYRAQCACGQGFLRFYEITLSNDWGQTREEGTSVELLCDCCKNKYHYEQFNGAKYLVPNDLSFPKQEPQLKDKYRYSDKESLVQTYEKSDIEAMIKDMTAPKHRYIKDLENREATAFAQRWYSSRGKKSLGPMISYLQEVLQEYDDLKISSERKKPFINEYKEQQAEFQSARFRVEEQSFKLSFQYDEEQDQIDHKRAKEAQDKYEEEHRYDDFMAQVHYDPSYKKDFINHYWDSYFIKECTDSQHFSLRKPQSGMAEITIAKKYACVCQICGKEAEILSSDMKISYKDDLGYFPETCCDCHTVSSFEAKTMDILNRLGITYIREKSFEGLVGDSGRPLRFDFALSKSDDEATPIIDLVIELQGPHHYKMGYYNEFGDYITGDYGEENQAELEDKFSRQLRYDKKKTEYCSQHEIKIETIKYTVSNDYEQLEKRLTEILKKHGYRYYTGN